MKKIGLLILLIFLMGFVIATTNTEVYDYNGMGIRSKINYSLFDAKNISATQYLCLNSSCISAWAIVDTSWLANWTAFNDSWSSTYNQTTNDSINNHILSNNGSIVNYIAIVNTSMKNYVDFQNQSQTNYINYNNISVTNAINAVANAGEPLWTANYTAFNATWSNTTNMSYVPYTGANQNVNLGSNNLTVNSITFTSAESTGVWTEYLNSFSGNQNYTIDNLNSFIFLNKTATNFTFYDNTLSLFMNFDNRSSLGENDTIVKDLSLNGNNGNIFGANLVSGKYGSAYNFSTFTKSITSNTYVKVSSLNWVTKSYWINIYNTWQHILVKDTNATYVNGVLACPSNMAYINKLGGYCIDRYEASTPGCEIVGNNCGDSAQTSYCTKCVPTIGVFGSASSSTGTNVTAYSKQNVAPLVRVSQLQARQMCVNAGKHLCTDQEWLGASNVQGQVYNLPTDLAVAPYRCVTGSSTWCNYSYVAGVVFNYACNTSQYVSGLSNCSSSEGVYDITGNVWDWTNGTVDTTKTCGDPKVSEFCYINATSGGWQSSSTSPIYGNDYTHFIGNSSTGRAVIRGGYWATAGSAGPFCAFLAIGPTATSYDIGFRCCDVLG